jgi:hypothetical protein
MDQDRFDAEVTAQLQQENAMDNERFAALMADMVKARAALGNVTKNKKANAGSHSYAYSDLAAVTATVAEALDTSGAALWFTQAVTTTEQSVTVVSEVYHANGASHKGAPMTLPVLKRDPQGFGSAISYARRYSMLAFWGIAAEDDDGKSAGEGPQGRQEGRQAPAVQVVDDGRKKAVLASLKACESRAELSELWNSLSGGEQDAFRAQFNDKRGLIATVAA